MTRHATRCGALLIVKICEKSLQLDISVTASSVCKCHWPWDISGKLSCEAFLAGLFGMAGQSGSTLPETNMETQKGPYKDYSPSKIWLHGSTCWFGGV